MNETLYQAVGQRLLNAGRILVISHIRPDGDAVGSLLGLGLSLQAAGKDVQMLLEDGVPTSFRHLVGSNQVVKHPLGAFDVVITVDCSDMQRAGSSLNGYMPPQVNIDHHVTNDNFAELNLVIPEAVATSAILAEYIPLWNLPFNLPVAEALLTGILSDSLGFRTSNMNPQALRLAASLMEQGANLPDLYNKALSRRSFAAMRYWGVGLTRLQRRGNLIWTSLTLMDRKDVNYPGRDDADLINVLSQIEEGEVEVIFIEQGDNRVKVSWRAEPGFDVSGLAVSFGGGGHPAAAGAEITGTLEEVQSLVLEATQELMDGMRFSNHAGNEHLNNVIQ